MAKTGDICQRTGEYQDQDGVTKSRWLKIGVEFTTDKGRFLKLEALPLPNAEGEVLLSVFDPKPRAQQHQNTAAAPGVSQGAPPMQQGDPGF